MQLTPLFKMLLVGVFALACFFEGGDAVLAGVTRYGVDKIKAVQKIVGGSFSATAESEVPSISSSVSTRVSISRTIKLEIKPKTETEDSANVSQPTKTTTISTFPTAGPVSSYASDEARAVASLTKKYAAKAFEIATLHEELLTRRDAYHTSRNKKLSAVNASLSSISHALNDSKAVLKLIQKLLFSSINLNTTNTYPNNNENENIRPNHKQADIKNLLAKLSTRAGDNQQINWEAITRDLKKVLNMLRETEADMDVWDAYVETMEEKLEEVKKDVRRLEGEFRELAGKYGRGEIFEQDGEGSSAAFGSFESMFEGEGEGAEEMEDEQE
ncbi:hypothetical protein ONS96_013423 [Cadophora gregata f. sp. sojae]|nr:hypothetical protein ONS96_013423 [Cadophora gregata f. sp. sojae]